MRRNFVYVAGYSLGHQHWNAKKTVLIVTRIPFPKALPQTL